MPPRPLAVVPPWRWWVGFFLVTAVGGYLTIVAYAEGLPAVFHVVPQFDKAVHFVCAGMLAFFLDGALRRRTLLSIRGVALPLAAAGVLVPAGVEEFLQRYAEYRTSSIWDFCADMLGVIAFIPLSRRAAQ